MSTSSRDATDILTRFRAGLREVNLMPNRIRANYIITSLSPTEALQNSPPLHRTSPPSVPHLLLVGGLRVH
jgi:hypothetical protein